MIAAAPACCHGGEKVLIEVVTHAEGGYGYAAFIHDAGPAAQLPWIRHPDIGEAV